MANIAKVQVEWAGIAGMPGFTTFYCDAGDTIPRDELEDFFFAFRGAVPTGLSWTIPSSGDIFADNSGTLVGSWSQGSPVVVSSNAVDVEWAGGTGAVINWATGGIAAGRRVRGRTFMVPINTANYDNGHLTSSFRSGAVTAAAALVSAAGDRLRVWHRPVGGSGGSSHAITAASVPDLAAVLRSRRD